MKYLTKYAGLVILFGLIFIPIQLYSAVKSNQAVIDEILGNYKNSGAESFSAKRGFTLWSKEFSVKGKNKSCVDCHGEDLTQEGRHIRSGKVIDPMAAWVELTRYTKVKKVEKWFKRNCKSTWGRECTPQEKGDFLMFLRAPLLTEENN